MFVGLTRRIICTRGVDGRLPIKSTISLPASDFYTFVTPVCDPDLCIVLLHFTPFEICSRWTKVSHPNHIAWNVMILSDDNVNWLFLYFFRRGERCNSDVNTVNGKTEYDVIQRHWIPLTTRTLVLKQQCENYNVYKT